MKELEVKAMLEDSRIPEQYKRGGRLSSEFLDGVDYAEQRIMEKGVEMWVARDYKGVGAFTHRPISCYDKEGKIWLHKNYDNPIIRFRSYMFPELTLDNSPVKARIILED
jgi:hypothetical protein